MHIGICAERPVAARRSSTIEGLRSLANMPFGSVDPDRKRNAYGVPYVELEDQTGGKLWVTQHGWRHLACLDPQAWFADKQYRKHGRRLSDGSGAVYRYRNPSSSDSRSNVPMVVKFSRFAQDVQFGGCAALSDGVSRDNLDNLVFNDPFQEFGLVEELRRGDYGPSDLGF
jgi:hypothetical protein